MKLSVKQDKQSVNYVLLLECEDGTYGAGCLSLCNCAATCHSVTGYCPGACDEGWFGEMCQTPCQCSVHCEKETGHCPGQCHPGWVGDNCQQGEISVFYTYDISCISWNYAW